MAEKEMLSEFTRKRICGYAGLLEEIARGYSPGERNGSEVFLSRADLFAKKEMDNRQEIFSDFIKGTSKQLLIFALDKEKDTGTDRKQEKKICRELQNAGIAVKEYCKGENRNGYTRVEMVLRAEEKTYYDLEDIADLLTEVLRCPMTTVSEGHQYVRDEWTYVCFQEETAFQMYAGFAKVTKEGEELSGDNFLLREFDDGTYIAAIADGMGSGAEACEDSERVLTMVERYIETGLSVKNCLHVSGEMLYVQHRGERSVSLDLAELNLYTGECRLYKNGAAPSFLIRKKQVREFVADRLSLGISPRVEGYRETVYLKSQDIILLMSDGVMDLFYDHMDMFESYITAFEEQTLPEMTAGLLQMAIRIGGGLIRDDMTILAIGICEKGALPVAF